MRHVLLPFPRLKLCACISIETIFLIFKHASIKFNYAEIVRNIYEARKKNVKINHLAIEIREVD